MLANELGESFKAKLERIKRGPTTSSTDAGAEAVEAKLSARFNHEHYHHVSQNYFGPASRLPFFEVTRVTHVESV